MIYFVIIGFPSASNSGVKPPPNTVPSLSSINVKVSKTAFAFFVILHILYHNTHYLISISIIVFSCNYIKNDKSINRVIQVNDIDIGKNITLLRKSMRIKQTDMVARLQIIGIDISIYSYNRIEKGKQNPTVSFYLLVAEF